MGVLWRQGIHAVVRPVYLGGMIDEISIRFRYQLLSASVAGVCPRRRKRARRAMAASLEWRGRHSWPGSRRRLLHDLRYWSCGSHFRRVIFVANGSSMSAVHPASNMGRAVSNICNAPFRTRDLSPSDVPTKISQITVWSLTLKQEIGREEAVQRGADCLIHARGRTSVGGGRVHGPCWRRQG